jgi:hypothetical protein
MRFEVLKAVNIKNGEFCDVTPCSFIYRYQRSDELATSIFFYSEDGGSCLFITLLPSNQTTRCYVPENCNHIFNEILVVPFEPSPPHTSSRRDAYLIKHGKNFTFTLHEAQRTHFFSKQVTIPISIHHIKYEYRQISKLSFYIFFSAGLWASLTFYESWNLSKWYLRIQFLVHLTHTVTKINRLMLFREIIAFYSKNHRHINTFVLTIYCGAFRVDCTYSNYCALRG